MSKTPEQLLKLMTKYATMASQEGNLVTDDDAVKTAAKKTKKKLDPKAKVRNRGNVCVPAESAKDKKDHFPINDEAQARNALARVHQYSSVPSWYSGSLKGLQNAVSRKVHSKYPGIGKDKKKSAELYINEELLNKYAQGAPPAPLPPGSPPGDLVQQHRRPHHKNKHHQPNHPTPTAQKPAQQAAPVQPVAQKPVQPAAPVSLSSLPANAQNDWKWLKQDLQNLAKQTNSGFESQEIMGMANLPNPTLKDVSKMFGTFTIWRKTNTGQPLSAEQQTLQQEGLNRATVLLNYFKQPPTAQASVVDRLINKYSQVPDMSDDKLEANSPEYQEELEAAKTKQAPAPFVATPTGQAQAPVVKRPPAYYPPPDYKPDPPTYYPPPDYKPDPPAYYPPPNNPNGVDFEIDDVKASSIDRLIKKYSQVPDMSSMLGQLGNMVQQAPAAIGQLGQSAQMATQIANITGKLSTRPAEAIQPITTLLQSVAKNPQSASQTANMLITALSTAWGPMSAQVGSNAPFLGQMQQLLTALMAQLTQLRIPGVNLNVLQQMQSQVVNLLQVANLHPVPAPATPSDELERKNNVRHHKFSHIDFLLKRYSQQATPAPRQALTFQRGNETEEIVDPVKPAQQEVIEFPANPPKPVPAKPVAKPRPAAPKPPAPAPTGYAKENIDPWTHQKWDPNAPAPNVQHPTKSSSLKENIDPWTGKPVARDAHGRVIVTPPKHTSLDIFDRMIAKYAIPAYEPELATNVDKTINGKTYHVDQQGKWTLTPGQASPAQSVPIGALPYAIDESGHKKMYNPKDVQQALKDQGGPQVQQKLVERSKNPSLGGVDGSWGQSSQGALDLYLSQHPELKTRQDAVAKLMGETEPTPAPATPSGPASTVPPAPSSDTPSGTTPPLEVVPAPAVTPPATPEEQKKRQQHHHRPHHQQGDQRGQVPPPPPNAPPGSVPDYYPPNQPPPPPYGAPQGQPQFGPPGQPQVIYEQGPGYAPGYVPGFGGGVGRFRGPGFGGRGPVVRPGGGGRRR